MWLNSKPLFHGPLEIQYLFTLFTKTKNRVCNVYSITGHLVNLESNVISINKQLLLA